MKTWEEKLADLRECGVHFTSSAAVEYWSKEKSGQMLRQATYEDLIFMIGALYLTKEETLLPSGQGAWTFDTECVYDASDYVKAMNRAVELTRGEIVVSDVQAHFEDTAWLRFRYDGRDIHWDLQVDDDWIDLSFVDRLDGLLRESGSSRRYCCIDTRGQDVLLLCLTEGELHRLKRLCESEIGPIAGEW